MGIDNNIDLKNINKIHFIGIGGIGMSALAFSLLAQGKKVSGSDKKSSNITDKLINSGAEVYFEHKSDNINNVDLVVLSTAIDKSNSELIKAKELNIPICHRSDILNYFLRSHISVAVTGTHGKTSTSAMMSLVLHDAKLDPTALVGGQIIEYGSNVLPGTGKYLVAEVDESDQSIHKLTANYAIITNLETDHLDHYKDLEEIIHVMNKFINNLPQDGKLIVCKDSYGNNKLIENCPREVITYSLMDESADYRATDVSLSKNGSKFKVLYKNEFFGEFNLPISGIHYVANALSVIACSTLLGIDKDIIQKSLANYKGVKRRFEIVADIDGTLIIDDYAHHPTEIKATLASASLYQRPTTVAFQPHRFSRTKGLLDDFSKSFELADRVIIADIYGAGEQAEDFNISSEDLVKLIKEKSPNKEVYYIKDLEEISKFLHKNRINNELILTMGAGTITNLSRMISSDFLLPSAC
ncbi:MAG: UDP-N-acetylmuramate--L-alanine ligase [Candidatus Sericytochromatia bacterium]